MAYLREPSEARKKLLDGLKKMFAELDQTGPSNLVIAIEMEPGPLYSLADGGDIEDFASEIKDYCEGQPELGRRIGLNLDIAHWGFLAKLSPDWVRERPQVFKRVVHAHVSDHASGGHFGDVVPLRLHEENEFADWLTLLEEIDAAKSNGNQDESTPPFSGIISGELEACLCLEQVAEMARAIGAH
jgi:sugar phosphate isomerase/epimerase